MNETLEAARNSGFNILLDPESVKADPQACRIIPSDVEALGITLVGDVLEVLLDHIPTPAEFSRLENLTGMLITVTITTKENYQIVKDSLLGSSEYKKVFVGPALTEAIKLGASDLHLSVGVPPIVRVGGKLTPLENWSILSPADLLAAAEWALGKEIAENGDNIDFDSGITYGERRWRVNIYKQRGSIALSLRLIPIRPPRLDELGLPQVVTEFADLPSGLVLFAGPTGSGKSTSLAGVIDRINSSRNQHILTIEDPIEYQHANKNSMIHQREVGSDTESFAVGLRAAMRQDPDVILVGELRDQETMETALRAAETGHLVFATVHASSAEASINRLISSFPASQQVQIRTQLASSLQAVVCQALIPTKNDFPNRVLATEILIVNTAIRTMIRDDRMHEISAQLDASAGTGMVSMEKSLGELVRKNKISIKNAEIHANDLKLLREYIIDVNSIDELDMLDGFQNDLDALK